MADNAVKLGERSTGYGGYQETTGRHEMAGVTRKRNRIIEMLQHFAANSVSGELARQIDIGNRLQKVALLECGRGAVRKSPYPCD